MTHSFLWSHINLTAGSGNKRTVVTYSRSVRLTQGQQLRLYAYSEIAIGIARMRMEITPMFS